MIKKFIYILIVFSLITNGLYSIGKAKPIITKSKIAQKTSVVKVKKKRKRHPYVPRRHSGLNYRRKLSANRGFVNPYFNPSAFLLKHQAPNVIPAKADSDFLEKYSKLLRVSLDTSTNTKLIAYAAAWLGCPYRFGGNSKLGTDCSGFVSSLYREVYNLNLSHGGASMLKQMGLIIKRGMPLKEGDILFFRHGKGISHVAMYLRDNKFIHAATHTRGVVVDDLRDPYFARTFTIAGRPTLPNSQMAGF